MAKIEDTAPEAEDTTPVEEPVEAPAEETTPAAEPVTEAADLPLPFQKLSDAATAAGQSVADFCTDAVHGGTEHADAGEAVEMLEVCRHAARLADVLELGEHGKHASARLVCNRRSYLQENIGAGVL